MDDHRKFGVFDKEAETEVEIRHLPHWFQPGTAVFVTLRTADSLPRSAILQWHQEIRHWLQLAGLSIQLGDPLPEPESLPNTFESLTENIEIGYGIGTSTPAKARVG